MGDLISRQALRDKERELKIETEALRNCSYKTGYITALSTIEWLLARMETVDAEPVRHERWVQIEPKGFTGYAYNNTPKIKCSVCEQTPECVEHYECDMGASILTRTWYATRCCPNCGAKMDKEG